MILTKFEISRYIYINVPNIELKKNVVQWEPSW